MRPCLSASVFFTVKRCVSVRMRILKFMKRQFMRFISRVT